MSDTALPDWQQTFSQMFYWKWEGEPSADSVASDVGFMERELKLPTGARVLDLGCGLGWCAIELARRGYDVTALDWSVVYLEEARRRAEQADIVVTFINGDMTKLEFAGEFDLVLLWGNTFGMLSDEDNRATLRGIARALQDDGRALIWSQNYTALPSTLGKEWHFNETDANWLILSEDTRDIAQGRFGFTVTAIHLPTGERHCLPFSWRLYLTPELRHIVADAGLELLGIYGDDPKIINWANWKRGDPYPYSTAAFTDNCAVRTLLCGKRGGR
jgi:SAM-dependent methyltransferase